MYNMIATDLEGNRVCALLKGVSQSFATDWLGKPQETDENWVYELQCAETGETMWLSQDTDRDMYWVPAWEAWLEYGAYYHLSPERE